MATVIDYSAGVPSSRSIKSSGHIGSVRYISAPREGWMKGKPIGAEELKSHDSIGLQTAFVYQFSKADTKRGYSGGVEDARKAQARLDALGRPDHPVFFTVDYDITLSQWNGVDVNYFRGAASVLGLHRVGIYGHSRVCSWAVEDGVVAKISGAKHLCWVTRSWGSVNRDGSPKGSEYSVLFQRVHDIPGPDGIQIDVNDVLYEEWGQKARRKKVVSRPSPAPIQKRPGWVGDPTWLPEALRAFGVEVYEDPGWDEWGNGDFKDIRGVVAHHTASNNTSKELIRYGHSALRGLLSQIHLERSGRANLVGVGIAYHAGEGSYKGIPKDAANWHMIGVEAVSDGVTPWPAKQLDAYYRTCAAICWVLDRDSEWAIAHFEWSSQGKWDPGAGDGTPGKTINMQRFRRNVQHYIDNPPFQEELMAAFDEITTRYKSRVDGSDFSGRPIDYLLNTDLHAFTARVNTLQILKELRGVREDNKRIEAKLDQLLIK